MWEAIKKIMSRGIYFLPLPDYLSNRHPRFAPTWQLAPFKWWCHEGCTFITLKPKLYWTIWSVQSMGTIRLSPDHVDEEP